MEGGLFPNTLKFAYFYDLVQTGFYCVIIASILWLFRKIFFSDVSKCPPTPGLKTPTLSVFGSLYTFPSSSVRKRFSLPLTAFIIQTMSAHAKLFEKEKLFFFDIANQRFIVLTKGPAVEELLRSNTILRKGWVYNFLWSWLGTGLLTSYGSKWKTRRRLLTPSFHFEILKDFIHIMDEQSRILINNLKARADEDFVDVVTPITLCSLDIICETTLGVHVGAQSNSNSEYVQAVLRASVVVMDRFYSPLLWLEPIFRMSSMGRQFAKDINILHTFTRKVIHQKKAALGRQTTQEEENSDDTYLEPKKKRKALMDLLIEHQTKHQDITEEDIREEIDTFAFAGHDTTSMGMSWALYLIGLYPEVQAKLHEELDSIYGDDVERPIAEDDIRHLQYLERVLKESQRLYPSVPWFGRQVDEDLDFCGYRIKKGSVLSVLSYSLHRDPEAFPDPEKFDPDRFLPENSVGRHPFAFVPFSAGSRNCIGQRLALLEEKIVIANVLRHFDVKSLDQRDKIFLAAELILRPACPLRVKFTPRSSAL